MLLSTWVVVLTFVVVSISKEGPLSTVDFLTKITEEKFKASQPGLFSVETPFPKSLNASWILMPPFVRRNSSDHHASKSNTTVNQIDGILPYILNLALNMCCAAFKKNETVVSYQHHPVHDKSELHKAIMKDEVHLILPVQSDDDKKYKKHLPYLKLFESPGIVLIRSRDSSSRGIQNWSAAVGSCWQIVVLTVLLSIVAGICVWALETKKNSKEFGSPFCYGIFDGFWWAFVTMATVGYGDKTPKTLMARMFSVIWIMIGITLCSMLTATLSSAFTNVTVDYYGVLSERKVGVVKDSIALQKAVNLGANVKVFEDLDEVHNALVNKSVDGILEELFTATEYFELQYENPSLSIVHFYEEKHGYGIAFKSLYVKLDFGQVWDCMSFAASFIANDNYDFVKGHIHRAKLKGAGNAAGSKSQELSSQNWPVFAGIVFGFCGLTLVILTIDVARGWFQGRCMNRKMEDSEKGREKGEISLRKSEWSPDKRPLAFAERESIKE
ncbi:potassium voltage-gated channel subfamily B member 1-like [Montipora foliosa]|uniref:potassium voltage-gated channel subfamily B member 1-like n=1 Tax=Montipora foliosa TaxID=591990 RepID=UPI0035F1E0C8